VILDAMTSGRAARGERWAFARYRSAITVTRDRLLLHDAVELDPAHGPLDARMGRWDALATIVAIGPRAPALHDARDREWLAAVGAISDGTILRGAARSAQALHRGVRAALSELPALLGDDPFARKY
jgi:urease accessory protein